jgi:hypothetical protein
MATAPAGNVRIDPTPENTSKNEIEKVLLEI